MSLYAYSACMQGLTFGVHFDLLQIFLCKQLPCSADWGIGCGSTSELCNSISFCCMATTNAASLQSKRVGTHISGWGSVWGVLYLTFSKSMKEPSIIHKMGQ